MELPVHRALRGARHSLHNVHIDPEEWSGFAFGMGIDRVAMLKYEIPSIRTLFENDLRVLEQF